ncbi:unnamed protein product [Somion occarium]|uniref:Uncharacterized protein n=1 Tax=Somion occarium TaxID=3059160 RepID=A0ABP1DRE6_9APHY
MMAPTFPLGVVNQCIQDSEKTVAPTLADQIRSPADKCDEMGIEKLLGHKSCCKIENEEQCHSEEQGLAEDTPMIPVDNIYR